MDGYLFERCMVETVEELAKLHDIKHKPLAEKAWPKNPEAGNKWRYIRRSENPRGLQLCDAYDLASALGMSFVEVCGLAQAKLLQKKQGLDVNFRAATGKEDADEKGAQKSVEA